MTKIYMYPKLKSQYVGPLWMRNWPNEISVLGNSFWKDELILLFEWECFDEQTQSVSIYI